MDREWASIPDFPIYRQDVWVIADSKLPLKLLPGKLPNYVILFQYMINFKTDNGILGS